MSVFESYSEKDTYELGRRMGEAAKAGEIYALTGDLGTGKTVFTAGFARGLGIEGYVDSPTFTIVKEYREGRLPFFHFDVYRIADPDEMFEIGFEEYIYSGGVCLIEWAELIEDILPEDVRHVTIEKDMTKGYDYRKITVGGTSLEDTDI
ncbi:MAG: tRNA (adenosine(37)-N6)-threonylcarbamoyltransferase complex ATPase subunit type 1 TsaE [Lachnospiraceae bacterium]|nr:tRNA (adenosine(37)-N6)-threonylcarbamoyltransferase complex ATPase subunit type 1 TsaE [Lachnospiraceae bacterium]